MMKKRWIFVAVLLLRTTLLMAVPPGCKPPELTISREHPLIILYGPGSAELTVKCWQNLQPDIKPYCVVTMDPTALDVTERLAAWRRMLKVVQDAGVPIALQVCGPGAEWTTPMYVIETLLQEFSCIKIVQIVEMRCGYYTRFGGDLEMALPANLRYLAEVLKLCGRYGRHLSLQIQGDMVHLGSDALSGPLRELFRTHRDYFLPQHECIGPMTYATQTAAWGLWLAEYCEHWGMEPQWWWWTKGESYFIKPGVFGIENDIPVSEEVLDLQARLYRAFIIQGALLGATVYSIEPPQDVWEGEGTDQRHFDNVIYPTLRQIIDQKLIASREEVFCQAKVAYQLRECKTLHEFDLMLQDLDLEVAQGRLEKAAYGVLHPHLMKEMIPDTGGRYYFIPLLPVGTPEYVLRRFGKIIQPGECASPECYRALLDRHYPATENGSGDPFEKRAYVLKSARAVAVMQSRENLYEKQSFTVDLPRWVTGLRLEKEDGKARLLWDNDSEAQSYRVWKRIPGAKVYPEWELISDRLEENHWAFSTAPSGTYGVSARTTARRRLNGTVNYAEYLLFQTNESPILEQLVITGDAARAETVSWTNLDLPGSQEIWRLFEGVQSQSRADAEAVLDTFAKFTKTFEARNLDTLMSFYDPHYRDTNGYSIEYVRRAWLWWYQRTTLPYAVAQVRTWDTSRAGEGIIGFTAWNRFRGTIVWDEPFGYHGRVRIPRHENERVTWTWKRNQQGQWKILRTEPALPNFGEMLWIGRGHDVKHVMSEFADQPLQ